jgi:glycosyltransferase involved in cell wall biosynthesis
LHNDDEIVIIKDAELPVNDKTTAIINSYTHSKKSLYYNSLNKNYGAHKNFGIEQCKGEYVFQIDGDECPPESLLGENLHVIIENNPTIEAFAVPRINDFRGVTQQHASQWGWRLTTSPTYKRPVVNWPDYQFRIFKREYPRISFNRRLHEKIEGYLTFVRLPEDEEYALYHDKTIDTQIKTNLRYNQVFSQEENQGHGVFK